MQQILKHLKWLDDKQEEMQGLLESWSRINSGSHNLGGLLVMLEALQKGFGVFGAEEQVLTMHPQIHINTYGKAEEIPVGPALHLRKRPEAPVQVLLSGHMDTVFSEQHAFQDITRIDDNILQGPGVSDMKGGLIVMLKGLQCFENSPFAEKLGWEVFISADEEIGSPSSAAHLTKCAKGKSIGMIHEPSRTDGKFINERKGSSMYTIVVRGKSAHVGRHYSEGRSALRAACELVCQLESLNDEHLTLNVGQIDGGAPVNIVPDLAILRFNIRVTDCPTLEKFEKTLEEIIGAMNRKDGITAVICAGTSRTPKIFDEKTQKLFAVVAECCAELSLPAAWQLSGGVCDGNILSAAGLPTIDTLGVVGGGIHTPKEFICLDSLVPRAKLTAMLLMRQALAADEKGTPQ